MVDALVFLLTLRTWHFSGWNSICQFFLPVSKPVQVVLQTHYICLVVNGEVRNSVICKEAHGRVKVLGKVVDIKKKQARSQHWALGDSWCDWHGPAPLPIDNHHLRTVGQEALDPVQGAAPYIYPVPGNFPQQVHVTDFVKSLTAVHYQ